MKTALSQGRSFGVIKLPTHGLLSGSRQSRERPDCAAVCELEIIHGVHGVRDSADPWRLTWINGLLLELTDEKRIDVTDTDGRTDRHNEWWKVCVCVPTFRSFGMVACFGMLWAHVLSNKNDLYSIWTCFCWNPIGAYDIHSVEERRNVSPFHNGIPSFILTFNLNLIAEYTRSEYRQDRHKVQHKNLN